MCRNIKPLFNYDPPTTDEDMRAAARQFVRKVSGYTRPSQANQAAFDVAIEEITRVTAELLAALVTNAPPRDREAEVARARARAAQRSR